MRIREMLPWNWGKHRIPVQSVSHSEAAYPEPALRDTIGQVIEDFLGIDAFRTGSQLTRTGVLLPPLDAFETDDRIRVSLELPGMDAKDVDITLTADTLTIKGEKSEESERDEAGAHWIERRFGSFRRVVPLPCEVEPDSAKATFRRGVLEFEVHKSASSREKSRGVPIQIQ